MLPSKATKCVLVIYLCGHISTELGSHVSGYECCAFFWTLHETIQSSLKTQPNYNWGLQPRCPLIPVAEITEFVQQRVVCFLFRLFTNELLLSMLSLRFYTVVSYLSTTDVVLVN